MIATCCTVRVAGNFNHFLVCNQKSTIQMSSRPHQRRIFCSCNAFSAIRALALTECSIKYFHERIEGEVKCTCVPTQLKAHYTEACHARHIMPCHMSYTTIIYTTSISQVSNLVRKATVIVTDQHLLPDVLHKSALNSPLPTVE